MQKKRSRRTFFSSTMTFAKGLLCEAPFTGRCNLARTFTFGRGACAGRLRSVADASTHYVIAIAKLPSRFGVRRLNQKETVASSTDCLFLMVSGYLQTSFPGAGSCPAAQTRWNSAVYSLAISALSMMMTFSLLLWSALSVKLSEPVMTMRSSITITL